MADTVIAYIGLGSNLEQPFIQIKNALTTLAGLPDTSVIKDSGYYVSSPMGPEDQPDYVNAVVEISTSLGAFELLQQCQQIEQQQGRIKKRHWGERTIDLDILLYGNELINAEDLVVPHPGILQRDFVYLPLMKINPDVSLPGSGMLSELISSADSQANDSQANDSQANDSETNYDCRFSGNIE